MSTLPFFKLCLQNEFQATYAIIKALPDDQMEYRPHPISRSAYEIAEHIIAHAYDLQIILQNNTCDECLRMPFAGFDEGATLLEKYWKEAITILENFNESSFDNAPVELLVSGKPLLTLPRANMMWFFLFDIIHHRGQLSSYIRPMGGKNPAVYGYSADTI